MDMFAKVPLPRCKHGDGACEDAQPGHGMLKTVAHLHVMFTDCIQNLSSFPHFSFLIVRYPLEICQSSS